MSIAHELTERIRQLGQIPAGVPFNPVFVLDKVMTRIKEVMTGQQKEITLLALNTFIDRNLLSAIAFDAGMGGTGVELLNWAPIPGEICPCPGCQAKAKAEQPKIQVEPKKVVVLH